MKILDFFRGKRSTHQRSIHDLSEQKLIEVKEGIESRAAATGRPLSDFFVILSNDGYRIGHYGEDTANTYATPKEAAEYFRTRESLPAPPDSYLKQAEEVLDRHFGKVKN